MVPSTAPIRPPIVHIYLRSQETNNTCPPLVTSSSDLDLPIDLRKGTRTFKSTYSIANFVSYDGLSSTSTSLIVNSEGGLNHPGWYDAMFEETHAL